MIKIPHEQRFTLPYFFHLVCSWIPYLAILSVLALTVLLVILVKVDILLRLSPFLILLIIAALIILWKKKTIEQINIELIDTIHSKSLNPQHLYKIYAILFLLTLSWLLYAQSRDAILLLLFFLLYAVSVVLLFSKSQVNPKYIVLQLFLTSVIFAFSQVICHAFYYGIDDIFPHTRLASGIIETGNILTSDFAGVYQNYNLFHISIAETTLLSGLNIHISPYIVMIIPTLTAIIYIYYLAVYFTKSSRIAAASALCYLLIPIVLRYTTSSMPFVLATLGYIIILYFLFQNTEKIPQWSRLLICGIIILYMTMVHHMSVPIVFLGTIVLVISYSIYKNKINKNQLQILTLFISIPLLYLLYNYIYSLVAQIDMRFIEPFFYGNDFVTSISSLLIRDIGFEYYFITYISLGLIVILLIFGLYYLGLKKNISKKCTVLLPFAGLFIIIFLPGLFEALFSSSEFSLYRFRMMFAPVFAIVMGIGCWIICSLSSQRKHIIGQNISRIIVVALCLGLVILSPLYATSSEADVYLNTSNEEVNYFNMWDISMLDTIERTVPVGSEIRSDHILYRYYASSSTANNYGLPYYTIQNDLYDIFTGASEKMTMTPYVVFRHELYERGELEILLTGTQAAITFLPDVNTTSCINQYLTQYSKGYENGFDSIYL